MLGCLLICSQTDEGRLIFWSLVVLEEAIVLTGNHPRKGYRGHLQSEGRRNTDDQQGQAYIHLSKADGLECGTKIWQTVVQIPSLALLQ